MYVCVLSYQEGLSAYIVHWLPMIYASVGQPYLIEVEVTYNLVKCMYAVLHTTLGCWFSARRSATLVGLVRAKCHQYDTHSLHD